MPINFLDNVTFPQARVDLNAALNAVGTNNAGATAPTDFQAFTPWLDTSGAVPDLKFRNASNSDWVSFLSLVSSSAYRRGETFPLLTGTAAAFTQSAGVKALFVEVFGASGGGGGVDGQGAGTIGAGAAGGNGGYASKFIVITTGETFSYTIGAAGVGGAAGNNAGTSGGTTSFTGSVSGAIQVTGGAGGAGSIGAAGAAGLFQGAAGVGSGGDQNLTGNIALSWYTSGSGNIVIFPNNSAPLFGFGTMATAAGAGSAAAGLGAGGQGGFAPQVAADYAGGNGFRGEITVTEFY